MRQEKAAAWRRFVSKLRCVGRLSIGPGRWLDETRAPGNAWEHKLDQMIWVGSPTNPLRQAFQRCASGFFGRRLVHRMPKKEPMHELAWRASPATG